MLRDLVYKILTGSGVLDDQGEASKYPLVIANKKRLDANGRKVKLGNTKLLTGGDSNAGQGTTLALNDEYENN